jgi:transcriptional antiterminator NusG
MNEGESHEAKFRIEVSVDDLVKIVDGPFRDYEGKVLEVDEEHGRVKVSVPVFGRETVIEIDSGQLQKI